MSFKNPVSPTASLRALVEQAVAISGQLECGQAFTPVSDVFQTLGRHHQTDRLVATLVSLDSDAEAICTSWSGEKSQSQREIVIRIFSSQSLIHDPAAFQVACTGSHVLVIVGTAEHSLDEGQVQLLRDSAGLFAVIWPVILASGDLPNTGWWRVLVPGDSAMTLPPSALIAAPPTSRQEGHALERGLASVRTLSEPLRVERHARMLYGAVQRLARRVDHERNYLTALQPKLDGSTKLGPARATSDCDKEFTPLRDRFAEESMAIDRHVTLKSERALQPLGELSGMMRSIATSLNVEDLERTQTNAMTKLSVNASHLARINRQVEHVLHGEFTSDLQLVERETQRAALAMAQSVKERLGEAPSLRFSRLDVNHAWRAVENLMAVGKETHIELARKGFFDVLTAGRQKVFIIIMFASLMGRMGMPNLFATPVSKAGFGLFMALVMISSMVNAILHWRREKQLQSEKEMSKIRDSLLSEGNKVIDQVEKAKLSVMREYLKEASKQFDLTVKQFIEEVTTRQRIKRELEAQRQDAARKTTEGRVKQLSEHSRALDKLIDQTRDLCASAAQTLKIQVQALGEITPSAGQPALELPTARAAEACDEPVADATLVNVATARELDKRSAHPRASTSALAQRRLSRPQPV